MALPARQEHHDIHDIDETREIHRFRVVREPHERGGLVAVVDRAVPRLEGAASVHRI
ncbi:hypothetical protein ACFV29_40240 [Streptomyces sp. NPDC059690]|uniref:hypothetical protein n=1 Tax=Streptomyces sp. NPDC059690 TaxID=3346907 RepID=UPI0036899625